jgi:hypothetical protein
VASRSGDYSRAAELYDAAREQFRAMVSESEIVDTDARIAETLVFQGRSEDAIELATACLERTAAHGGATQDPMLYRIRGYAHAQQGASRPRPQPRRRSFAQSTLRGSAHP